MRDEREVSLCVEVFGGDDAQGFFFVEGFEEMGHARQVADRGVEAGGAFDEIAVQELRLADDGLHHVVVARRVLGAQGNVFDDVSHVLDA